MGKKSKSPQSLPEFLPGLIIEDASIEIRFEDGLGGIIKVEAIINSRLFSTEGNHPEASPSYPSPLERDGAYCKSKLMVLPHHLLNNSNLL